MKDASISDLIEFAVAIRIAVTTREEMVTRTQPKDDFATFSCKLLRHSGAHQCW